MSTVFYIVDRATGLTSTGTYLTAEQQVQMLVSGWDVRSVVCGTTAEVLVPGEDSTYRREIDIWVGPHPPAIPADFFIEALRECQGHGGELKTLDRLCKILFDRTMGEVLGVDTGNHMEQQPQSSGNIRPTKAVD